MWEVSELLLLRTRFGINLLNGNALEQHLDALARKLVERDSLLHILTTPCKLIFSVLVLQKSQAFLWFVWQFHLRTWTRD